jgi:thiol-disulfide isomerase/thioredoxin
MKPRVLLTLALGLTLLAPACTGKGGAETAGQTISAARSYNVVSYRAGDRRTPAAWNGPDLHGGTLRSESFRGSVTVVNFWASWCGPCRKEQAELEKLWADFGPRGAKFLGITVRDTLTNARAHVDEFAVTYPSVFTENDSTIAHKFRVLFVPTTFVLDRNGRIAAKIIGPTKEPDLRRILDQELST